MRAKPCPFCGSPAEIAGGGFDEVFVQCSNMNCGGRLGPGIWFTTEDKAVEVWNKRAEIKDEKFTSTNRQITPCRECPYFATIGERSFCIRKDKSVPCDGTA